MDEGFQSIKPTDQVVQQVNLWQNLWNDPFVEGFLAMNRWARDQVPFPGAAFRQTVDVLIRRNALLEGVIPYGGGEVRLKDVKVPVPERLLRAGHDRARARLRAAGGARRLARRERAAAGDRPHRAGGRPYAAKVARPADRRLGAAPLGAAVRRGRPAWRRMNVATSRASGDHVRLVPKSMSQP